MTSETSHVPTGQLDARLDAVERAIDRHRQHPTRAPIAAAQREAFNRLCEFVGADAWVLDAGCGTGSSSFALAERHELAVVGIDRSAHRLTREPGEGTQGRNWDDPRVLRLRADLPVIWRLLREAGRVATHTYLLYPNPNPKPSMLGHRWHAHPCFTDLLASSERVELRTNWRVYAEEFAHAINYVVGGSACKVQTIDVRPPHALSLFERKYAESGHELFSVASDVSRSE